MPDTDRVAAALLDARGRVVWWSRAAEDLLGWTSAQIAGTSARDLLEPDATGSRPSGSARRLRLRHSSGAVVEADVHLVRSDAAAGGTLVLTAGPDGLVWAGTRTPPSPAPSWARTASPSPNSTWT
ncbi:PAS domain-containing protein [Streptomyces sp. CB02261]|uniref:PAS domain-containing protein n=1 Tax=Streptomyces sp. CB02261 TaxID=1703940 RepID=UPI0009621035|nr:PAS domain-containing protein [Streptomyces sp. CB02261]OKJ61628.1 hypothetical protein AMK29_23880 [Streptomyces sp. CB02261]